jgi:alkanesulfonate monooxygenase SsuD/methylene tetrahydromethanopterin reductase-like flavin-dependent oxidoreductase (luciferase family)
MVRGRFWRVRIGISPFASSREVALDLAATAVAGGVDSLWLGDGYLSNPDFAEWAGGMETMTELSWLSGALPSARVGITAAVLPIRDIHWLAKQANTLHRLAGGGFVLVAAPGFWRQDLEARGADYDRRGRLFDWALDLLLDVLADPRYSPGPPTGGPPPVWLAGAAATMRKAAARGLPFQSSRALPDALAHRAAEFFDRGGTQLAHRVRLEIGHHEVDGQAVDWHAVTGSVDRIVDVLGRYRDLGVSDLSIIPGTDDETSRDTLDVLVDEIVPQL